MRLFTSVLFNPKGIVGTIIFEKFDYERTDVFKSSNRQ